MVTRETRSRSGHDLVTIWSRSGRVAGRWAGPWVKSSQVKTSQVKSMPGDGLAHGSSQVKSRSVNAVGGGRDGTEQMDGLEFKSSQVKSSSVKSSQVMDGLEFKAAYHSSRGRSSAPQRPSFARPALPLHTPLARA